MGCCGNSFSKIFCNNIGHLSIYIGLLVWSAPCVAFYFFEKFYPVSTFAASDINCLQFLIFLALAMFSSHHYMGCCWIVEPFRGIVASQAWAPRFINSSAFSFALFPLMGPSSNASRNSIEFVGTGSLLYRSVAASQELFCEHLDCRDS